jgi:hypothetical protein
VSFTREWMAPTWQLVGMVWDGLGWFGKGEGRIRDVRRFVSIRACPHARATLGIPPASLGTAMERRCPGMPCFRLSSFFLLPVFHAQNTRQDVCELCSVSHYVHWPYDSLVCKNASFVLLFLSNQTSGKRNDQFLQFILSISKVSSRPSVFVIVP